MPRTRRTRSGLTSLIAILLTALMLAASCSSSSYPYISSSRQQKYMKKSNTKYGKASSSSIPIKSNYKIKE